MLLCIFNTLLYIPIDGSYTAYDVRARRKRGPWSRLDKYIHRKTHVNMGLAHTLFITRKYMEHGCRLPADCTVTAYYLPTYPP